MIDEVSTQRLSQDISVNLKHEGNIVELIFLSECHSADHVE